MALLDWLIETLSIYEILVHSVRQVTFNVLSDSKWKIYKSFMELLFIFKVKEVSVQADEIKNIFSSIDRKMIEVEHMKERLQEMQNEKTALLEKNTSRATRIAQMKCES